jgi:hypothetical protein
VKEIKGGEGEIGANEGNSVQQDKEVVYHLANGGVGEVEMGQQVEKDGMSYPPAEQRGIDIGAVVGDRETVGWLRMVGLRDGMGGGADEGLGVCVFNVQLGDVYLYRSCITLTFTSKSHLGKRVLYWDSKRLAIQAVSNDAKVVL